MRDRHLLAGLVLALFAGAAAPASAAEPTPTSELLHRDIVVDADLWDTKPRMLAAGLGFTNILGVPGLSTDDPEGSEERARAAGGAWNTLPCTPAQLGAYTSAVTPEMLATTFGYPATFSDGLPVEFSWPIRPSSLGATDFRVTLSDGSTVTPELAAVYPNQEYNERAVTVLVGHFGNRTGVYAVKTTVVRDATPLQLIGPGGRPVSAVGLSASATAPPYGEAGIGPRLAAAKLTRMSTRGEGAPRVLSAALPNDGVSLYGDAAKFRLRVFTTGGFSPDGVRGVLPTEFSRYFRLRVRGGGTITRTGVDYHVGGGTVRVLGLADLGRKQATYDDCYQEDHDNQIDIVLAGDASAVSRITGVEIPAGGEYSAFFNPGGPGNAPTPHVPYSAAGPAHVQPVTQALDDPMTVTFHGDEPSDRLIAGFERGTDVEGIVARAGGVVTRHLDGIHAAAVRPHEGVPASAVRRALEHRPEVRYVEPDATVHATAAPDDPLLAKQYALGTGGGAISAPLAWDSRTACAKVAVLDSGVQYSHPDLQPNVWHNANEIKANGKDDDHNGYVDDYYGVNVYKGSGSAGDDDGHGTHVAGILGGRGNNALGVSGTCWSGTIMPVRFMDAHGRGSVSDAIAGLQYAVDEGAKIVNCSFGSASKSTALHDAIDYAQAEGTLLVVAAGNDGESLETQPLYPASYTDGNILTVAATTAADALAGFSNYGSKSVDLAAPGDGIYSTYPSSTYTYLDGTSMAAPYVAAAAAMLRSEDPGLSYSELRGALMGTVDPLSSLAARTVSGGRLNVARALERVS